MGKGEGLHAAYLSEGMNDSGKRKGERKREIERERMSKIIGVSEGPTRL